MEKSGQHPKTVPEKLEQAQKKLRRETIAHAQPTQLNLTLHFLPPYAPQLNPIEYLWDSLRERWFSNRFFHSRQAVEEQIVNALQIMMKFLIKSITSSWLKT